MVFWPIILFGGLLVCVHLAEASSSKGESCWGSLFTVLCGVGLIVFIPLFIVLPAMSATQTSIMVPGREIQIDGDRPLQRVPQEKPYIYSGLSMVDHLEEERLYYSHKNASRPFRCGGCNIQPMTNIHYSENSTPPLMVWLCRQCHRDAHESLWLDRFVRVPSPPLTRSEQLEQDVLGHPDLWTIGR